MPCPGTGRRRPRPPTHSTLPSCFLNKQSVTLHTTHGDIKVELFCEDAPRSAENFLALAASGYYDGTIFHRNIKAFMVQVRLPAATAAG